MNQNRMLLSTGKCLDDIWQPQSQHSNSSRQRTGVKRKRSVGKRERVRACGAFSIHRQRAQNVRGGGRKLDLMLLPAARGRQAQSKKKNGQNHPSRLSAYQRFSFASASFLRAAVVGVVRPCTWDCVRISIFRCRESSRLTLRLAVV